MVISSTWICKLDTPKASDQCEFVRGVADCLESRNDCHNACIRKVFHPCAFDGELKVDNGPRALQLQDLNPYPPTRLPLALNRSSQVSHLKGLE